MTETISPKTERLWKVFQGRYGDFPQKDGQNLAYVKRSWELAFEHVEEGVLMQAARQHMSYSKYERWPSTGDLQEILDVLRKSSPRSSRDEFAHMSPDWKRDYAAFCDWWATIALYLGREGQHLAKRDEVFADFMEGEKGSFANQAVKAWRKDISRHWSVAVEAHLDRVARLFKRPMASAA